ncbi:hypothetical protein I317_07477 [Kwoniella heveanensis CBS 569]|nr:hypothetical protein I317_07477 [Kwoniella heveanensis CBS 569]
MSGAGADQSAKIVGVSGDLSSATTTTRTTGRTRVKSQRVLEAEDTKRFLKNQANASKEAHHVAVSNASTNTDMKAKGKGKKKEEETYCICKTNNDGPMIECGECNDW